MDRHPQLHIIDETWKTGIKFLCGKISTIADRGRREGKPVCKVCLKILEQYGKSEFVKKKINSRRPKRKKKR